MTANNNKHTIANRTATSQYFVLLLDLIDVVSGLSKIYYM